MKPVQFEQATRTLGYTVAGRKVPVVRDHLRGETVSCWRMNALERIFALFTGRVWLRVMHLAPPPASMQVRSPFVAPSGAPGKREPLSAKQLLRWVKKLGKKAAVVALALSGAFAGAAPAAAWTVRVVQSATSPDGRFRVELADYRQETALELFVIRIGSAAAPQKISGPLPKDHDVSGFKISPDSQHVVYRQGQTAQVVGGNWRLYVVPIAGGQVVNLTPTLVPGGNVEPNFTIRSGDKVRWVADAIVDETYTSFEASIAVRIFADGFNSGSVGAWR